MPRAAGIEKDANLAYSLILGGAKNLGRSREIRFDELRTSFRHFTPQDYIFYRPTMPRLVVAPTKDENELAEPVPRVYREDGRRFSTSSNNAAGAYFRTNRQI